MPEALPPVWLEGGIRIGIHTSIAGSHVNALESAAKLGCSALQIFSVNPRVWGGGAIAARITDADAKAFRERRETLGLGPLVIHANYLINLAAPLADVAHAGRSKRFMMSWCGESRWHWCGFFGGASLGSYTEIRGRSRVWECYD